MPRAAATLHTDMSATIIDPEYNWKQAASQEGVDYDAVRKSFMDQAYGFVANKAKVLFQDPFRLGFEIVHRNEKATKMVGIFAFRCNNALLYAPVFFVNGEIKAADMLYRGDVKRFVPLTDAWCAFLVRGANQEPGALTDKSRQRQPDAYMDRLAYPQHVKYASDESFADTEMEAARVAFVKAASDGSLWRDLLNHCADDTAMRKVLPSIIDVGGPVVLEKLASVLEGHESAQRWLVENYTQEELTSVDSWQEKKAAETPIDPESDNIVLINDTSVCKTAAERESVVNRGYALTDNRPIEKKAAYVEVIDSEEVNELHAGCGHAKLMLADGKFEDALILCHDSNLLNTDAGCDEPAVSYSGSAIIYMSKSKELKNFYGDLFGDKDPEGCSCNKLTAAELKTNGAYVKLSADGKRASDVFVVTGKAKDGECTIVSFCTPYGRERQMLYSPGREKYSSGEFISDDVHFLEVDAEIEYDDGDKSRIARIEPRWTKVPMDNAGIDRWMRTAGNLTDSADVEIKVNNLGLFDITAKDIAGNTKVARDLGMLEAHLKLANDFELTCDAAGEILDKTVDNDLHRFRVYDTMKSAFMTRMQSLSPWIEGFDPELGVKVDTPQRQIILTHTPERARQTPRYGDHYDRPQAKPHTSEEDGLPHDALMTQSPEQLAQLASQYNIPHIFDHGMLGHMAKSTFNTITQIQQYIPDLETGVDRYFRILFLLRYRPADFEEAYGKDELMEMEHEFSQLASTSGDNLLRLLKRLDLNKTTNQGS